MKSNVLSPKSNVTGSPGCEVLTLDVRFPDPGLRPTLDLGPWTKDSLNGLRI